MERIFEGRLTYSSNGWIGSIPLTSGASTCASWLVDGIANITITKQYHQTQL